MLSFTFAFIVLQNGLHIKELSISNVKIEQLYIKWDEKVDVSIKEILIDTKDDSKSKPLDYNLISHYIKILQHTTNWFHSIVIENIKVKNFDISFKYKQNSQGFFIAKSPSILITTAITSSQDILNISVEELIDREKKIVANGNIYLDLSKQEGFINFQTTINKDANLTLFSSINSQKMDFRVKSNNNIHDIKYIIKLASLPKEIKFWTQDAITLDNMDIQTLKGKIDFNNLQSAYKNIYVQAKANNLLYTYNTQLDGVHTEYTDLEFKDGVLFIRPKNAFSYKNSLGESWLKIDFTKKEELLTLFLLFDGKLDKGMLTVLDAYKIKLPFLQKKGSVSTDLKLAVNLMSIDVDAQGSFYTKKANFDYLGLNIDIFDTKILLNNYDVKIDKMRAHYKEIAKADVKVDYNAKTAQGNIDFKIDYLNFKKFQLNKETPKLNVSYHISPNQDVISIAKSQWHLNKQKIDVDALQIPFDLNTLNLDIPTTFINAPGVSSGFLEGNINLKDYKTDLTLDLLSLSYEGVSFPQSNTSFKIKYKDKLSISSPDDLFFTISGTEYMLNKPTVTIDKDELRLKNTKLIAGHYATTKIYAKYNLNTSKTHISLSDFKITNYKKDKVLYSKKKILFSIEDKNDFLKVSSKELGATITSTDEGWKVYINSLAQIATDSEFLQKFHLNKGNFTLYKNKDDKYVQFDAKITYPYKILTQNSKPTNVYNIKGKLKNTATYFTVNKNTSVNISDVIKIKTRNTGINITEIVKLTEAFKGKDSSQKIDLRFKAIDSYLYISESRKVISEVINLQYVDDILTAQLQYKKGKAGLRLKGKKFHLYGKDFNDKFMHKLLSLSKFKGGTLDFSMDGTTDEYNGVLYINNSTIIDYKLLNNILAFINTVPSLVTFSLPDYSNNGLHTKQAYVKFKTKNNIFNISDIYLESKELTILGNGNANLNDDTIDIKLNLKTDLGKSASKIPVVGYILFDKESVSTTLKITGKLSDPDVETLLARDIAVAPLNIIKRTLTLPYNMLNNIQFDKDIAE